MDDATQLQSPGAQERLESLQYGSKLFLALGICTAGIGASPLLFGLVPQHSHLGIFGLCLTAFGALTALGGIAMGLCARHLRKTGTDLW